jgi:hypothetical protein
VQLQVIKESSLLYVVAERYLLELLAERVCLVLLLVLDGYRLLFLGLLLAGGRPLVLLHYHLLRRLHQQGRRREV